VIRWSLILPLNPTFDSVTINGMSGTIITTDEVKTSIEELDTALASTTTYWNRVGSVLSPKNSGDSINLDLGSNTGPAVDISATGSGAFTGVYIDSDTDNSASSGFKYTTNNLSGGRGSAVVIDVTTAGVHDIKAFKANFDCQSIATGFRSGNVFELTDRRIGTFSAPTENYNLAYFQRHTRTAVVGTTNTQSGTVITIENADTRVAGTIIDSITVLRIIQDSLSTGIPLSIDQNATISTNFRKTIREENTGVSLWFSNGNNPDGTLSGTTGDVLFKGDDNEPALCNGTTNWSRITSRKIDTLVSVVAGTGISSISDNSDVIVPVESSTAGDTTITANPAIVAGHDGQRLTIIGTDNTKTVTFNDGNGLALDNGQSFTLGENDILELIYYNSLWIEITRKDN